MQGVNFHSLNNHTSKSTRKKFRKLQKKKKTIGWNREDEEKYIDGGDDKIPEEEEKDLKKIQNPRNLDI